MDKKTFKTLTRQAFEEYGFKTEGKCYYLYLYDVVVCATLFIKHNTFVLGYNFCINAIHDPSERKKNDIFTGYDSRLNETYDENFQTYIECEDLNPDEYLNDLIVRLPKFFDPFKNNAIEYIKNRKIMDPYFKQESRIMVNKKAQEYMGIDLSK